MYCVCVCICHIHIYDKAWSKNCCCISYACFSTRHTVFNQYLLNEQITSWVGTTRFLFCPLKKSAASIVETGTELHQHRGAQVHGSVITEAPRKTCYISAALVRISKLPKSPQFSFHVCKWGWMEGKSVARFLCETFLPNLPLSPSSAQPPWRRQQRAGSLWGLVGHVYGGILKQISFHPQQSSWLSGEGENKREIECVIKKEKYKSRITIFQFLSPVLNKPGIFSKLLPWISISSYVNTGNNETAWNVHNFQKIK